LVELTKNQIFAILKNMRDLKGARSLLLFVALFIGLILLSGYYSSFSLKKPQEVSISEVARLAKEGKLASITNKDNELEIKTKTGETLRSTLERNATLKDYGITPEQVEIKAEMKKDNTWLAIFLNSIVPVLLIGLLLWLMLRQAQGANIKALSFGASNARPIDNVQVTFRDVAGLKEAKQELEEVVEFLKNPEKFRRLGAEIPRGVLLVGPPGAGKTLLAKAVAGEADVPFFSISASEFVEMFVGVGASRVRDLFAKAKRNSPSIIFIDELDAIGRHRGAGLGGGHDEREQTLNQILVEMDGFETNSSVIVMSATNRPDILDPALLRPGRFDRRIVVDLPDKRERLEILKVHTRNKPLAQDVDLEEIARRSPGLSGADLKNIANEAAIFAARENRRFISQADFTAAIEKVIMGPEKRSRVLSEQEKRITAYHEAGHAVVGRILPNTDPVHKVTIVSRGAALGYTLSLPLEDVHLYRRSRFEDMIAMLLGGRVAEEIVFGEVTTGAENDLREATKIARKMVTEFGMSDKLGPVTYGEKEELVFLGKELGVERNYSDKIATLIDEETRAIIEKAYTRAQELLKKYRDILDKLAEKLLKEETVEGREFEELFKDLKLPLKEPAIT
jgi:cell division protease FtsH